MQEHTSDPQEALDLIRESLEEADTYFVLAISKPEGEDPIAKHFWSATSDDMQMYMNLFPQFYVAAKNAVTAALLAGDDD